MAQSRLWFAFALFALVSVWLSSARSQPAKPTPRPEPVAETKLLMEGLADPNMRALGRLLAVKPKDAESWKFARGQSLLLAEMGNLLMLRPPKTKGGEEAWLTHASDLRESAATLARAAAAKDYLQARTSLASVANACNRCHQTSRVSVRVDPFAEER